MTETALQTKDLGGLSITALLANDSIKVRFEEVLGPRRGAQYISSMLTTVNASKGLSECQPMSVMSAGAQAAALDLSIVPTIGQAAMVPYGGRDGKKAQFQIMTKGIIQLAHRTNKYKKIRLAPVYEGQLVSNNDFTGEIVLSVEGRKSDRVMGLYFFFELLTGFRHEAYWSTTECMNHGWKYSKAFSKWQSGLWVDDPLLPKKNGKVTLDGFKGFITYKSGAYAMCAKTVVKNELNKWGPLSADMLDAFTKDQAVLKPDGTADYIDSTAKNTEGEEGTTKIQRKSQKAKGSKAKDALPPPQTEDEDGFVTFGVERVGGTEKEGKTAYAIVAADGLKRFTSNKAVADMATKAKEDGKKLKVRDEEIKGELWIIEAASV